jgi:hypothetical protein
MSLPYLIMDKRTRKLRQHFPKADEDTRLVILGAATRLVIGDKPLQLTRYEIGKKEEIYAAYSEETNTIYIRLLDISLF